MKKTIANTQAAPLALVTVKDEARIDSRLLAESIGSQHRSVFNLINTHKADFNALGKLRFEIAPSPESRTGQAVRFALLTEDHSYLLLTYTRNTERTRSLKVKLVQAFSEARRNAQQRKEEYLPGHHLMHDTIQEKCSGSGNAGRVHMNFEKLINRTVGIESGQRSRAPVAALTIAQQVAVAALAGAVDHHDGYQRAKDALRTLQSLIQAPGVTHG